MWKLRRENGVLGPEPGPLWPQALLSREGQEECPSVSGSRRAPPRAKERLVLLRCGSLRAALMAGVCAYVRCVLETEELFFKCNLFF